MSVNSYFNEFLSNIRLSDYQRKQLIDGHTTLRNRLNNDVDLSKVIVSTFLQGSYRRATSVKPKDGKRADVDIIVVTNLDQQSTSPQEAINLFIPFVDKFYEGKYRIQGRSIGITLSYVDLDIVITSAPSEVDQKILKSESVTTMMSLEDLESDWLISDAWTEPTFRPHSNSTLSSPVQNATEWKAMSLYIPDQDADCWVETNPLEQIRWTRDKNKATNGHYINVVKALKWWRICKLPDLKHPKGYPIEHMIGECCPDGITSVAEGIVQTLDEIVRRYAWNRNIKTTPVLSDHGVLTHDVWKRVSNEDFVTFYDAVKEALDTANKAKNAELLSEQLQLWQSLFDSEFPTMDSEEARCERLAQKAKMLESGTATIGSSINVIKDPTGIRVPRERNYYDKSNL